MTFVEFFLVFAMGVFILTIAYATSKNEYNSQGTECPPHKWESVENYKTKDELYTGLMCSKCKQTPYQ